MEEDIEELEKLMTELKEYEAQREMEPVDDLDKGFGEDASLQERTDEAKDEINAMLDANQAEREKAEMEAWAAAEAGNPAEKELEAELDATVGTYV